MARLSGWTLITSWRVCAPFWHNNDKFAKQIKLADAQWFPRSAITAIISHPDGSSYSPSELKKLEDKSESNQTTAAALAPAERKPGDISGSSGHEMGVTRVPPATAIAGVLIREWAKGGLDLVSKL